MTTIKYTSKEILASSKWVLCIFILLISQSVLGQYTISGPITSNINEIKDYNISGSGPSYGQTQWHANGGTVISSTLSTARVRWTQAGSRNVGVTIWYNPVDSSPEAYPSLSVTVLSNDPPIAYTLSNNGPSEVCTNIGSVRLSDSEIGATYRLYRNNSAYGSSISGTNSALTWSSLPAGTYTVRATKNSQTVTMNGSVTIATKTATPIAISVAGGSTNVCANTQIILGGNGTSHIWINVDGYVTGSNPAYVTLSSGQSRTVTLTATNDCGDEQTTSVTLNAASAPSGATITSGPTSRCRGTGTTDYNGSASNASTYNWSISPTSAGTINGSGTVAWSSSYTGTATITFTASNSCNQSASATRQTTVSAPPAKYNLSAPAEVCSTGTVTLSDSQSGINYQLFRNNVANGSVKAGTGSALSWSGATPGTYKVVATRTNGVCGGIDMNNQVTIGSQTATPIAISVGVSDINNICSGTQIVLGSNGTSHSWSGVDGYLTGTNPAYVNLAPGETRTISVSATNDCGTTETDSVTLSAKSTPSGATIASGPTSRCIGAGTSDYNGTASNASEYTWSISPTSAGTINSGGTVTWSGSYTGTATITFTASNSCSQSDSATRQTTVSAPPAKYNLSAPAEVCTTGSVTLSDTQSGVTYQLFKNNVANGSAKPGTGSAISWSGAAPGTYKVVATNANGVCGGIDMNNQVTIDSQTATPIAISVGVSDINNICPGTQIVLGSNGTGHSWSGVDGYITGTNPAYVNLAPGETRTISVSATNDCGSPGTDSITITAKTTPSGATIDSGPSQICQGTVSSDYVGSASNADSYLWTISPAAAGTINGSGIVTWNGSFVGTATITYSAENGCNQSDSDILQVAVTDLVTYYEDVDRDGYYVDIVQGCTNPDTSRYVTIALINGPDDCDDSDQNINPATVWKLDADGDNHALVGANSVGCEPPNQNYDDYTYASIPEDDCNDSDISVFEVTTWYLDSDNDGYYVSTVESCVSPGPGYRNDDLVQPNDCDDTNFSITNTRWYIDTDGDQLGDPDGEVRDQCDEPTTGGPWVLNGNDPCPADPDNLCGGGTPSTATGANYVYSRAYQVERTSPTAFFTNNDSGLIQQISYYDGLGRPQQQIGLEQSPNSNGVKKDIVNHSTYDGFGRMTEEWLPYATPQGTFGNLKGNPEQGILGHYATEKYQNTANPFSEKNLENSPLNRVRLQAAPGNDWAMGSGHEIEFSYDTNATDEVLWFSVDYINDDFENPSLVSNGYYTEGELNKQVTFDENHTSGLLDHSTAGYNDKLGRTVLKRTYDQEIAHDTYYVYDDYGNLTYVLPPKMEGDPTNMDELGYQYVYDHRNRLVEKKIPGKGWEHIIYNKLDQPIMTQDANQRENGEWLFTKYDAFGRVAYTGKAMEPSNRDRTVLQNEASTSPSDAWVTQYEVGGSTTSIGGTVIHYNNAGYPSSAITEVLTENYYDIYVGLPNGVPTSVNLLGSTTNETNTLNVKGLPTVSKVKVLDVSPSKWINTVTYYDEKGRPLRTYSQNEYLGTVDIVESQLNFVGRPQKTRASHTRDGTTIVTIDNFTYDHVGRLLAQTQCIGDETLGDNCDGAGGGSVPADLPLSGTINTAQVATNSITVTNAILGEGTRLYIDPNATGGGTGEAELIVLNAYDELGQLENKKVGGEADATNVLNSPGLQQVDYTYNVRGWLKTINDDVHDDNDLFDFGINYNDPSQNLGAVALYNGNISETLWKTANDNQQRAYGYQYDALNRITNATDNMNDFGLSGLSYDKNGNILSLSRKGAITDNPVVGYDNDNNGQDDHFGNMDIITYDYGPENGNKLQYTYDYGNPNYGYKDQQALYAQDYWYDTNGNMTRDLNKGIGTESSDGITYNHLNLPEQVDIGTGNIHYTYDATGAKLKKTVSTGTVTDYAGNHVYEDTGLGPVLQFFNHAEGYVSKENGGFDYVYQYKDHLGNTRLSYTDANGDGQITFNDPDPLKNEIVEENNYYPFGLQHKGYNNVVNGTENNYKTFQGQELTQDLGLNILEFKYRFHDPAIGRFWQIDPLATKYPENSTYAFQENKLGLGTEFEGKETQLWDWLVREGATKVAIELDKKMTDVGMQKTEKSVASDNLYKMYKLQKSDNKGKAERFAEQSGLGGLHNGEGDAFRHSLFNALNSQTVGEDLTKKLGDAHEEDRPGQPANEKKMDLNNNEVGREVAKNNPDGSILELATSILDKLENGEMLTLDSKGNVTKSKLTKTQKAQILKNLQKLDENGNQQQNKKKKKYN